MIRVPLTISAKNEASAIGPCLDSLMRSIGVAERTLPVAIDVCVVADDCTDDTVALARGRGVEVVQSTGGKVEAMRAGARPGPFQIFSDADIIVTPDTIGALCTAMIERSSLQVAFPPKTPLPPRRTDPLCRALYLYNLHRGFSSSRTWFSGKLFAIRTFDMPSRAEVQARARRLPIDRFYDYRAGMRVDDIFLSRAVLREHGPKALAETTEGTVWFRAPETFEGMYRYYRRMRLELERIDRLFPETRAVARRYGHRAPDLLPTASAGQRRAWRVFCAALLACKARYIAERWYFARHSSNACDPWPVVEETKNLMDGGPAA